MLTAFWEALFEVKKVLGESLCLAFDTSNYTTSAAVFDGSEFAVSSKRLPVEKGKLGLRQNDALFHHIKNLPDVLSKLELKEQRLYAIGASAAPREAKDSYMPCFLAGHSFGLSMSSVINIPYYSFSHQQGHIAAAAWNSGYPELMDTEFLAWHISGGTTELLRVEPSGTAFRCAAVGGTSDLAAGQLIDRIGLMLGLRFPCGSHLDMLSLESQSDAYFTIRAEGLFFSLSGMENKISFLYKNGMSPPDIARYTLLSISRAVSSITANAKKLYGELPILFSGGVSSASLLRTENPDGIFCSPDFSTDNALGTAILTFREAVY